MIFFFEIPEILDNVSYSSLVLPTASIEMEELTKLKQSESLRNEFKHSMT